MTEPTSSAATMWPRRPSTACVRRWCSPQEHRTKLARRNRDPTNPRRLRQDIYDQLDRLWELPGATAGVTGKMSHALLDAIAKPALALL